MLQAILILVVFLIIAALMMLRKVSTLVALIIMGILIAVIAGVPLLGETGILEDVIAMGVVRLAPALAAVIMGAWLGQVMLQTGISQDMIRRAAELAGDRPVLVAFALAIVVAILFTTLGGLGAAIMVGTIVLPIMISVGIKPINAATIFLFSLAVGFAMNLINWQLFVSLSGVDLAVIRQFGVVQFIITAVVGIIYILYFTVFRREQTWSATGAGGTVGREETEKALGVEIEGMDKAVGERRRVPIYSLLTPFIPLALVLFLDWNIIPAFLVGIFYGALTADFRNSLRVMTKAAHDGVTAGAPAILLFVAIGIVLRAVAHPSVSAVMQGFLTNVIPSSAIGYILFFALLSPLALYRGPMNMFGLGAGIVALIISLGILPASAAIAGFMSAERMQSVGDPTNTHNVWTADFTDQDVNDVSLRLVPFLWIVAAASAVAAAILYL